ncbi:reverse transcriptase domain-containing protein [Tanacetum coccineum]
MQTARDRQKSYADKKHKPMDFQVGDKVMLKVSPWKGVVRFGKRGKLNPRYVGPFKVLEKVRAVAYKLELPQELSRLWKSKLQQMANAEQYQIGTPRRKRSTLFSRSNCLEDCQEKAYRDTWVEFKKLLIKKYCPRTEVQKMEDEFYHLTVKGNDLKTYVRRFQELATLCPTMVPDSEKMMEVFIGDCLK